MFWPILPEVALVNIELRDFHKVRSKPGSYCATSCINFCICGLFSAKLEGGCVRPSAIALMVLARAGSSDDRYSSPVRLLVAADGGCVVPATGPSGPDLRTRTRV